jgi:hypothetical protein
MITITLICSMLPYTTCCASPCLKRNASIMGRSTCKLQVLHGSAVPAWLGQGCVGKWLLGWGRDVLENGFGKCWKPWSMIKGRDVLENGFGKCWKPWSMIKEDRCTSSDEHMHQFLECLRFQR